MHADAIAQLLGLPPRSRMEKRVPKSALVDAGATTAADRKLIARAIESLHWVAALKPGNCGVAAFRDDQRDYSEIQVLRLELRGGSGYDRVATLLHRSIPYPVVLFAVGTEVRVSTAHLRHSATTSKKHVLDGDVESATLPGRGTPWWNDAEAAMTIAALAQRDLLALYDGWRACLLGVRAAIRTGHFAQTREQGATEQRRAALAECDAIEAEIESVRAAARRTPQRARQVTYTAALRELEQRLAAAKRRI